MWIGLYDVHEDLIQINSNPYLGKAVRFKRHLMVAQQCFCLEGLVYENALQLKDTNKRDHNKLGNASTTSSSVVFTLLMVQNYSLSVMSEQRRRGQTDEQRPPV